MILLEFIFTLFVISLFVAVIEVVANSIFGKSFILSALKALKSVGYKLFSKKNAFSMLKEIQRQTEKYTDKYSIWHDKVSKFQLHYYYEIEKIVQFLESSNDETLTEFNYTYKETVHTIFKLMKESEFVVTKKHHGELLGLLNQIKEDVKDIHEISNSIKVTENNEMIGMEMDFVKKMREKRQGLKGDGL
ncbi:hypothetical protein ACQKNX_07940 [Lysinibacillus sp. NPDC093712]|uniref:hypothetical protein n=1 Tax=Lysinibacillus sp. NPDC093712 TaxID=3390579 RepID=UPI003CFF3D96